MAEVSTTTVKTGRNNTQQWVILIAIAFVFWYWYKNRAKRTGEKCASLWSSLCTVCRQFFFEQMNAIDNNGALQTEVQEYATLTGISFYNAKVEKSSAWLFDSGKITLEDSKAINICMSEVEELSTGVEKRRNG